MKSTVIWALVVLNAVLLAAFVHRIVPENRAMAQQAPSRAGDYLMLPAEVNGGSSGIVVVLDQTNDLLGAMSYDETKQEIESMPKIDLKTVFQQGANAPARRGQMR